MAANGLGIEGAKPCGTQVADDETSLLGRFRREMDVHLVGAEAGAALAQSGEVEARRAALGTADVQHLALARQRSCHVHHDQ